MAGQDYETMYRIDIEAIEELDGRYDRSELYTVGGIGAAGEEEMARFNKIKSKRCARRLITALNLVSCKHYYHSFD